MLLCIHTPIQPDPLEKFYPAIISGSIIILLFIVGRVLDRFIKSREIRRNWYQKVIIDPNIQKLNAFYSELLSQSKISINNLVAIQSTSVFNDYIAAKATEMNKIKDIKRSFEYEFVYLVQTNFPEIAEELAEHIRNIEDTITGCLDKTALNANHYFELEKDINSKKHCIYSILYQPLIYRRPKLRNVIKRFWS